MAAHASIGVDHRLIGRPTEFRKSNVPRGGISAQRVPIAGIAARKGEELRIPRWRISGGYHFGGCTCLKYLESGGAWSFLVGIKNPSPLRKYVSVPMTT